MNETSAIKYMRDYGIAYATTAYPENGAVAATEVTEYFGFGDSANRLKLKKAADFVGVKDLQMLKSEALGEYVDAGFESIAKE